MDTNLYSRQIYTYGIDTMEKIISLKILVVGLRGLGIEIAKNLILSGPKEVSIYDRNICKINDLGSNFYIEENDIGPISIPVYVVEIEKIDSDGNIISHSIVKAFYDLSDAKNYCESEMQDYLYNTEAKTKTISNDDKALLTYKIMLPSDNIINITINEIVTK